VHESYLNIDGGGHRFFALKICCLGLTGE